MFYRILHEFVKGNRGGGRGGIGGKKG